MTEKENPMRRIYLEKVVVNIGAGEGGERLQKAEKVLSMVTGKKPVITRAKVTNRDLGVRKGMSIGVKVTLRGDDAVEFLKKALSIRDNKLADYSFDQYGNFAFGIADYTDFEGMKYDPNIGIFGMDVCAVLTRPGRRVEKRKRAKVKVSKKHRVTREEAIKFLKEKFNVEIVSLR
ncbi:MAG: 50S ribosomal protein L5 [Thermoplasmata archaeon]|nr:50S ribosomal protein L5 [Thermoplasmata archaeon]